jgi:hypothetical protein
MLPKENVPGSPHGYAAGHPLPVWVIFDAPQAYRTGLVYHNDRRCGAHSDTSELCDFRTFLNTNVAIAFKSQSGQLGTDSHRQRCRYTLTSGRQETLTSRPLGPLSLGRCWHI